MFFRKPYFFGTTVYLKHLRGVTNFLGRQSLAPFCTTRTNNFTSGFRSHTGPETMGALTANVTGLEWSFHCSIRFVLFWSFLKKWAQNSPSKLVKSGAEYCEKARSVKLLAYHAGFKKNCPRVWITFHFESRLSGLSLLAPPSGLLAQEESV